MSICIIYYNVCIINLIVLSLFTCLDLICVISEGIHIFQGLLRFISLKTNSVTDSPHFDLFYSRLCQDGTS